MEALSVITWVDNNEHHVRRLMENVTNLAKEIIVVDTGCTDGTMDICREFGARVIDNHIP